MVEEAEILRRARALFDQGCAASNSGNPQLAAKLIEQALDSVRTRLGEENEHVPDLVQTLVLLYCKSLRNTHRSEAKATSKVFLKSFQMKYGLQVTSPKSQLERAWELYRLGRFCQWSGENDDAYPCFLQAVILGTEPGYVEKMDMNLGCLGFNRIGEVNVSDDRIDLAGQHFLIALNSLERIEDRTVEFVTNTNISNFYYLVADLARTHDYYEKAIDFAIAITREANARTLDSADSYLSLASVARQIKKPDDANELTEMATRIVSSELSNSPMFAPLKNLVALSAEAVEDHESALKLFEAVFQLGSTSELRLIGLVGMARNEASLGDCAKSDETFNAAINLAESMNSTAQMIVLLDYAKALKLNNRRLLDAGNMEMRAKLLDV